MRFLQHKIFIYFAIFSDNYRVVKTIATAHFFIYFTKHLKIGIFFEIGQGGYG